MYRPGGLVYDSARNYLFVSDSSNNRVLVFDVSTISNGMNASYVIGATDFTTSRYGITDHNFAYPGGLDYDSASQRLFVTDSSNHRVLIFNVSTITNGMSASYVLGQPDFTTNTNPRYKAGDNYLFVSDSADNRVLVFDLSSGITNGMDPINVLGRSDYTSTGSHRNPFGFNNISPDPDVDKLSSPMGLDYESIGGVLKLLFVADDVNYRVMVYDVTSITDGEDAIGVLGQTDFTSNTCLTTQYGLCETNDVIFDVNGHRAFVVDSGNHRIVVYDLIKILTSSFSGVQAGESYNSPIDTTNNQGTVDYVLKNGSLPPGMELGSLEGTATTPGTYTFTVEAQDNLNGIGYFADAKTYTVVVANPNASALPPIALAPPTPPSGGGGTTGSTNESSGFTIQINNNTNTTNNPIVTLTLNGGPDAVNMSISNTQDFKNAIQEPYKTTKEWTLTSGNGDKTVYVKYYTSWGQSSDPVSDSITLTGQTTNQVETQTQTSTTTSSSTQTQQTENKEKQTSSQTKQISQETINSIQQQIQTIMEKILEIQKEILKLLGV